MAAFGRNTHPCPDPKLGDLLIEVVSYSMLNLGLLFWLVAILQGERFQEDHPAAYVIGLWSVLLQPSFEARHRPLAKIVVLGPGGRGRLSPTWRAPARATGLRLTRDY